MGLCFSFRFLFCFCFVFCFVCLYFNFANNSDNQNNYYFVHNNQTGGLFKLALRFGDNLAVHRHHEPIRGPATDLGEIYIDNDGEININRPQDIKIEILDSDDEMPTVLPRPVSYGGYGYDPDDWEPDSTSRPIERCSMDRQRVNSWSREPSPQIFHDDGSLTEQMTPRSSIGASPVISDHDDNDNDGNDRVEVGETGGRSADSDGRGLTMSPLGHEIGDVRISSTSDEPVFLDGETLRRKLSCSVNYYCSFTGPRRASNASRPTETDRLQDSLFPVGALGQRKARVAAQRVLRGKFEALSLERNDCVKLI